MSRIISFLVVIIIVVAKYFIFRYIDDKKIAEQIEKSKTNWSDEYKVSYLSSCKEADTNPENAAQVAVFCECFMEKTETAGPFPTLYDPDKQTVDQYNVEAAKLEEDYIKSPTGVENMKICTDLSAAK